MGCLTSIAKYLVFLFNFLILICSILLIVFGAIPLSKGSGVSSEYNGFAIGVGVIILLVAFFGCCGAIREDSCLLTTYGVILIIVFIIQLILAILLLVAISSDGWSATDVEDLLKDKKNDTDLFDDLQKSLECCGVESSLEYPTIPDSCYPNEDHSKPVYSKGCGSALYNYTVDNFKILAGVAIGFGVIEIVGACFAFSVRNSIRRRGEYA